jgi:heterodisulfide reductase subunit C
MGTYPSVAGVNFISTLERVSGQPVRRCYQCQKCSGGCPVNFAADLQVHELIRLCQLGQHERALESRMIWLCTGCRTCQARCPNEIDGSRVTDALKAVAARGRVTAGDARVPHFHAAFLDTIRVLGRAHELVMMVWYKVRTRTPFQDLVLGLAMVRHRKLPFLPHRSRGAREVARIFGEAGGR